MILVHAGKILDLSGAVCGLQVVYRRHKTEYDKKQTFERAIFQADVFCNRHDRFSVIT
jgi:hypothetical protein